LEGSVSSPAKAGDPVLTEMIVGTGCPLSRA
jgi:hypothetical protein